MGVEPTFEQEAARTAVLKTATSCIVGTRPACEGLFTSYWLARPIVVVCTECWQIGETRQAGMTKKCRRRDKQVMRVVGDQPAFEQRGDGAVAGRAADELDAGAGDGLAVGDDGQHLERRLRERD